MVPRGPKAANLLRYRPDKVAIRATRRKDAFMAQGPSLWQIVDVNLADGFTRAMVCWFALAWEC